MSEKIDIRPKEIPTSLPVVHVEVSNKAALSETDREILRGIEEFGHTGWINRNTQYGGGSVEFWYHGECRVTIVDNNHECDIADVYYGAKWNSEALTFEDAIDQTEKAFAVKVDIKTDSIPQMSEPEAQAS